jgi:phosphoribosylanthranilate isomerase
MPAKVKICGLTRPEDADLAVSSGAWAIGMIFFDESPRRIDVETAAEIATANRRRCEVAGVFVNAPLDDVLETLGSVPLTLLQFHGDEGPAYCAEAARRSGLKVMKALPAKDAHAVQALTPFKTDLHMLDAYVPGRYGGTGEPFAWELAAAHRGRPPLVLAGGLTPENVGEALAVARPYAVDVASGVETSPGVKDPDRMRRFFEAVEQAAAPA